jgi:hypothetical protein
LELMGVESAKSVSGLVFTIRRDDTDERTVTNSPTKAAHIIPKMANVQYALVKMAL